MVVDYSSQHLGNYRLMHLLGHGGFASVYLGEHRYLERPAAIKVLRAALSDREKVSFLEEAKMLANLSHPHIVRVLEFAVAQRPVMVHDKEVTANVPFLVMDYAPGGNLRSLYPAGSILFLTTIVEYIKQIASALQYAHGQGIIHRDIKPENLLLNEQQEAMLSDFGLAILAPSPDLLSTREMAGTLPYTAPEQLQGKPCFASDQYSLGVITYEWLCGQRPFNGEDVEIIMQHIASPPPSLRSKNPSIPRLVEDVVLKALAKDPQQRYPSVEEFAQALERTWRMTSSDYSRDSHNLVRVLPRPTSSISPTHVTSQRVPEQEREHLATISSRGARKNRLRMLHKVRSFWITGVLEHSLHNKALIMPELREMRNMVASTWPLPVQQSEEAIKSYVSGTTITEIYDGAAGELLILGEAGSGKTTLLLKLAQDLLKRAEQDETDPIPVVFTLSSWPEKPLMFTKWLIGELHSKYQVPRSLGEYWIHNEMILPLLDGLDEVDPHSYAACVAAINTYRMEHGLSSLVVAGRLNDYLLHPSRLLLRNAVTVQPLTLQQVESNFLDAEGKSNAVYQALSRDPELRKLVTTPLMLSIVSLAYEGRPAEEVLPMCDSNQRYRAIFSTYVEQMLHRRPTRDAFRPQQVIQWLTSLAGHMQLRNQTIFYLEQIQGSYIGTSRLKQVYTWLAVLLPGMFLGMFAGILSNDLFFHIGNVDSIFIDGIFGLMMGYLFSNMRVDRSYAEVRGQEEELPKRSKIIRGKLTEGLFLCLIGCIFMGLFRGVTYGLESGIIVGVVTFLLSIFLQTRVKAQRASISSAHGVRKKRRHSHPILAHIGNGLLVGLAYGISSKLTLIPGNSILYVFGLALRDSLRYGLLAVLLSVLLVHNDGMIRLSEIISWSWRRFFSNFRDLALLGRGLLLGLLVAASYGTKLVLQGTANDDVSSGVSSGVVVAVGYCLIYTVLRSISSSRLDDSHRSSANEGILRSLRYAIFGSLIGAFGCSLGYLVNNMLYFGLSGVVVAYRRLHFEHVPMGSSAWDVFFRGALSGFNAGLHYVFWLGLVGGLLAGGLLGGLTCLQHGVLRLILRRTQTLPLRAVHFLDYAASTILLYKVGGGYIFIHRLLLEYFANLAQEKNIGKPG